MRKRPDYGRATPEDVARALLRPVRLSGAGSRPGATRQPVVSDQRAVKQVATDKARDGIPHLRDRS